MIYKGSEMSNTYVLLFKGVNPHLWVQRWSEEWYQRMTISNIGESRWVQMAVSGVGKGEFGGGQREWHFGAGLGEEQHR